MMCGFGMDMIFRVAIFIIVVLVVLALLRAAFGGWMAGLSATPYWNIIQIVIGGVIAIIILLLIWRLAECAGLVHAGALPPTDFSRSGSAPFRVTGIEVVY